MADTYEKAIAATKKLMSDPGFEESWAKASKQGEADYKNLPPPKVSAEDAKAVDDRQAAHKAKVRRREATYDAQDRGQIPQFKKGGAVRDYAKK